MGDAEGGPMCVFEDLDDPGGCEGSFVGGLPSRLLSGGGSEIRLEGLLGVVVLLDIVREWYGAEGDENVFSGEWDG